VLSAALHRYYPNLYCVRVFSQGSDTIYISTSPSFEVAEGSRCSAPQDNQGPVIGDLGREGQIHQVDREVTAGHFEGQLFSLTLQAQAGNRHVKLNWTRVYRFGGGIGIQYL
jgi:hypothetical protein